MKPAAGQTVGVKQVADRIWLPSFMDYDLGCFDDETCRLETIENPFGPKVLPVLSGMDQRRLAPQARLRSTIIWSFGAPIFGALDDFRNWLIHTGGEDQRSAVR